MKNIEIGTLRHAFRSEMSEIVHWTLVGAVAIVVGLQMLQAWAYDPAYSSSLPHISQIYSYFF